MTDAPARALERLGYEAFRPGQRETLEAVLAGRDVLAILPTGAGKSLVFQLAAELLDGLVVVASPLIALMRDQAAAAGRHGQDAAVLESTQAGARTRDELERALGGRADLLFVTPERLDRPAFTRRLRGARVALLVIDEAHCVSTWGHAFRPAYLSLAGAASRWGGRRCLPSRPRPRLRCGRTSSRCWP
ncbi:MAG: DEAD/DEAH box helicase [Thermoleophilia bacterium]